MKTVLAPLRLYGLGTPQVESLASFYCRLADAHQVTPKQLAKVLFNESSYLSIDEAPELKSIDLDARIFCTHSGRTAVIVERLERLTGDANLACGTLLRLRGVLSRNQTGSSVQRRRWCPMCYAQLADRVVEPLAWWIPQITHCPLHGARLMDRCLRCGSYQRDWRVGPARTLCIKCGFALMSSDGTRDESTPWETWCQAEMLKVLAHIATPGSSEISPNAVTTFIAKVVRLAAAEGRRRPVPGETAKNRVLGHRLATIFCMAAHCGTTPMDILLRPEEAISPGLFESDIDTPIPPHRRRFNEHGYRLCERTMRKLLALPTTAMLPPLTNLCSEYAVSLSNFKRKNSELCAKYSNERRHRIEIAKSTRFEVASSYLTNLIEQLRRSGKRLHRMNTVAQMRREIHVSKAIARSAIRVALAKMNASRAHPPSDRAAQDDVSSWGQPRA